MAGEAVGRPEARHVTHVTVAVLTFLRPQHIGRIARACLLQLDDLPELGCQGRLLVVDNDPQASASAAVAELDDPRVTYVVEPTPGIAAGRDRALRESMRSDLLCFIDDDQRPAPNWLAQLVSTWQREAAAAVTGSISLNFAAALDPWIEAGGFFDRRRSPTGTTVPAASSAHLLLDLHKVRAWKLGFPADLGPFGGEDTLLTRQLARRDRVIFCAESEVVEQVPADRISRRWVLARAFSHGNTSGLIDVAMSRRGTTARARTAAGGLVRVIGGSGQALVGAFVRSDRWQARGLRATCRGAGMTLAGVGVAYREYGHSGRSWRRLTRTPASLRAGAQRVCAD